MALAQTYCKKVIYIGGHEHEDAGKYWREYLSTFMTQKVIHQARPHCGDEISRHPN